MKRVAIFLTEQDEDNLNYIIDSSGCSISDAIRVAMDMVNGNFTANMVRDHHLMLKKHAREST